MAPEERPQLDKERREQYARRVVESFPETLQLGDIQLKKRLPLRYGHNPGTAAALYIEPNASGPNLANFKILQEGRGLGFINVEDMNLGLKVVRTLNDIHGPKGLVSYCVVKHEMPAGVALGKDSLGAFNIGYNSDPLSAFGGVHVFSSTVDQRVAQLLIEKGRNTEAVFALAYTPGGLETLKARDSLRVAQIKDLNSPSIERGYAVKDVEGGLLVESRGKIRTLTADDVEVVSKAKPTNDDLEAALFNWIVAAYTRSNAVVIGSKDRTHGIGSGQKSRIAAGVQAIEFANGFGGRYEGYGSKGTFMASDAFMPADDLVIEAAKAGVRGIIYPLGSIKDKEVIAAADERGLVMLATRKPGTNDCERVFSH